MTKLYVLVFIFYHQPLFGERYFSYLTSEPMTLEACEAGIEEAKSDRIYPSPLTAECRLYTKRGGGE